TGDQITSRPTATLSRPSKWRLVRWNDTPIGGAPLFNPVARRYGSSVALARASEAPQSPLMAPPLLSRLRAADWDPLYWLRVGLQTLGRALSRLWGRDVMLYTGGVSFFAML